MEKEMLKAYTARITQANRSELLVIVYEIILQDLESAKKAIENQDTALFENELHHAQKFMNELISALDFNYDVSKDLMQLYLFVNKCIIDGLIKKEAEHIDNALKVMKDLMVGFEGVAKEDGSNPVMQNTQQVYAGLTYGRGTLNETFIDPSVQNRGFKA